MAEITDNKFQIQSFAAGEIVPELCRYQNNGSSASLTFTQSARSTSACRGFGLMLRHADSQPVKAGKLDAFVTAEDARTQAKSYRIREKQAGFSTDDGAE